MTTNITAAPSSATATTVNANPSTETADSVVWRRSSLRVLLRAWQRKYPAWLLRGPPFDRGMPASAHDLPGRPRGTDPAARAVGGRATEPVELGTDNRPATPKASTPRPSCRRRRRRATAVRKPASVWKPAAAPTATRTKPPFGTHYTPVKKKASVPVGLIIGLIAVVLIYILGGIAAVVWNVSSTVEHRDSGSPVAADPSTGRRLADGQPADDLHSDYLLPHPELPELPGHSRRRDGTDRDAGRSAQCRGHRRTRRWSVKTPM